MSSAIKLRGVGIGAGYFAPFQYEAWTRIPEVEISALSDRSEARARVLKENYGIPQLYADWRQMIDAERPDFVDIITPPETHEEMCAYAAERGVHIICQKPLAPTVDISERIVATAKAADVRLMIHENWRWQPWYREIRKVSDSGLIGVFNHIHTLTRLGDGWGPEPYSPRQPFFRTYPRLLIYETGVHFIDTFRYLMGEVASVYAQLYRRNPVTCGEDAGLVALTFRDGGSAVWDASRYNETEASDPRLTFGQIRIDGTRGQLTMDTDANIRVKVLGEPAVDLKYEWQRKNFAGDCVYFLQRHFADCMISGKQFESSGEDYLNTIRLVQAVYDSAARSEVVQLC